MFETSLTNFEFAPSLASVLEAATQFSRKWVISRVDSSQSCHGNSQIIYMALDIVIMMTSHCDHTRGYLKVQAVH